MSTATIAQQILQQTLRTQNARRSARCRHVKVNGVRCGSPSLHGRDFCFFHDRVHHPRPVCALPPLEDANSIQVAIMEVVRAFLGRRIDHRSTGLLLYALQTASANLKHVNFEPVAYPVVRDSEPDTAPAEIPLSSSNEAGAPPPSPAPVLSPAKAGLEESIAHALSGVAEATPPLPKGRGFHQPGSRPASAGTSSNARLAVQPSGTPSVARAYTSPDDPVPTSLPEDSHAFPEA